MLKKKVKSALKTARKLEKQKIPTRKEVLKQKKKDAGIARKLRKLLMPSWFIKDTDNK